MGWSIFIGQYYSLTFIGMALGFFYPIFLFYFGKCSKGDESRLEEDNFTSVALDSVKCAARFGMYTFIGLTIFALLCGMIFTIWAIFHGINT